MYDNAIKLYRFMMQLNNVRQLDNPNVNYPNMDMIEAQAEKLLSQATQEEVTTFLDGEESEIGAISIKYDLSELTLWLEENFD